MMRQLLTTLFVFCTVLSVFASQLDTLKVASKSMGKSIANLVILPDNYTAQKQGGLSSTLSFTRSRRRPYGLGNQGGIHKRLCRRI